ncbi:MAG TPA: outer membrane lipoprotein carrier protein LolA [Candidatus Acidoferrum sp.]|nr:outer membrane lipoprotein carrier protein LolA [Candidatus Acidoferrum sp.]
MSKICLLFVFLGMIVISLSADGPSPYVKLFENAYRRATTLRASFLERYIENGREVRVEAGTAYFRRPGKMRWEYESPEKNLFLVDGKTAWFYVPADHTVTRVPAKESTDWRTPLALLAGETKVSRVCARTEAALKEKPESPDNVVLYCELRSSRPKDQKQGTPDVSLQAAESGQAVFFEIARNSGELVRVLIRDSGGVAIEFHFTNWKTDPPLSDSIFRFTPPPGVAIVNAELPPGNGTLNP